jgi:pimeloyl-ACP methyl ester carboxylesterase
MPWLALTRTHLVGMLRRMRSRSALVLGLSATIAGCAGEKSSQHPSTPASASQTPQVREMDVAVADFKLHVRIDGDPRAGVPLVAIPGGLGLSQEYLMPLARLATPTRAFVTFDPRGVGRSTRPASTPRTLADFAADTEAVRVAIGADKIHLAGHSYSGLLAMEYAIEHGDHLASLVLVDSIPPTGAAMSAAYKRYLARQQSLAAQGLVPAELPKYEKSDCREATLAWATGSACSVTNGKIPPQNNAPASGL